MVTVGNGGCCVQRGRQDPGAGSTLALTLAALCMPHAYARLQLLQAPAQLVAFCFLTEVLFVLSCITPSSAHPVALAHTGPSAQTLLSSAGSFPLIFLIST